MTRCLLVGPAGSGKTHRLLDEFAEALCGSQDPFADDLFFLVPSAEHTERVTSLIIQRGLPGFFRRRVTTLSRLFERIFGISDRRFISDAGRFFVLREILDNGHWPYFEDIRESPGLLGLVIALIAELKESLITPAVFREKMNRMKSLEPDASSKYEALAGLYENYESALDRKGLEDRHDVFGIYQKEKAGGALKGQRFRKIWMDGFFDFSPLQRACLTELAAMSAEMTVTLTLDSSPARRDLFEPVFESERFFLEMGFVRKELREVPGGGVSGALRNVAKNIFKSRCGAKKTGKIRAGAELQIFEAVGTEGEMEMVAREILEEYRGGRHRFSDFAVLFRQIGDYESILRSVFGKYGIPVEIHERERLSYAPMIQVIAGLLKIFRGGWIRGDLMEFLKSSYVRCLGGEPKDFEWVSELEHAAMAEGVTGGRDAWLGPWSAGGKARPGFDADKEKKLKAIAGLEDALRGAEDFRTVKRHMIHAVETTFGIFQPSDRAEDYVRRDAASYRRFEALLDEIGVSLVPVPGTSGKDSFFESFAAHFLRLVELDLFSLHEKNRNKVQVYDVSLARQKEYKAVFVSGLLEKKFPVQMKEDPVLSDWERALFNRLQGEGVLQERLPRQKTERYLFYIAVTRAREKLILTYPRYDLEGKEALRSYYVDETEALFDHPLCCRRQELGRPYPHLSEAVTGRELELALVGDLWRAEEEREGDADGLLFEVMKKMSAVPETAGRFKRAFFRVRNELADAAIAATDAFRSTVTSASALENYAKCPFKYYAKEVLRLEDHEEDVNVTTRGNVLHKVLETCFGRWIEDPSVYGRKKQAVEEALTILSEVVRQYPLFTERKYQYDLEMEDFREILTRFLDKELDRLTVSSLRPFSCEYSFGLKGDKHPALEIKDGEKTIAVRGKIDRVDVDADAHAGAVLDYKRAVKFSKDALRRGFSLQLPIYSLYLEKHLGLRCAGAELYSLRDCSKNGFYRKNFAGLFAKNMGRKMVLDDRDFERLLRRTEELVIRISRDMSAMKIAVRPRDPHDCRSFCPYGPLCRVEKWRLPMFAKEADEEMRKEGLIFETVRESGDE
jgi:ATP-dependent helicase/nuclease subunit B